jgi:hypothetical protein
VRSDSSLRRASRSLCQGFAFVARETIADRVEPVGRLLIGVVSLQHRLDHLHDLGGWRRHQQGGQSRVLAMQSIHALTKLSVTTLPCDREEQLLFDANVPQETCPKGIVRGAILGVWVVATLLQQTTEARMILAQVLRERSGRILFVHAVSTW